MFEVRIAARGKYGKKEKKLFMGSGNKILFCRVFMGRNVNIDWDSEEDEILTKEGKRKKSIVGAVAWILIGLYLGGLPFRHWEICGERPAVTLILECVAIGILMFGILKLKKIKP